MMAKPQPAARDARLVDALAAAPEDKVVQILSLVDTLSDREAVDAMIAPLRPRLAAMAPVRALTTRRLMFLPLDAVIVPTESWEAATGLIPRGMLAPVFQRLAPLLGDAGRHEAEIRALHDDDTAGIDRLGRPIWAVAAARVLGLNPDGDWAGLGLDKGQRQGVLASMELVFRSVPRLLALPALAADSPEALHGSLADLLADASFCGLDAWTLVLNLLLDPFGTIRARAGRGFAAALVGCAVETAAQRPEPRIRKLLEAGLARALARTVRIGSSLADQVEAMGHRDGARLSLRLMRAATLLGELSGLSAIGADERDGMRSLQARIAALLGGRLSAVMDEEVMDGLRQFVATTEDARPVDAVVLEAQAATTRSIAAFLAAADPAAATTRPWLEPAAALLGRDSFRPCATLPPHPLVPHPPEPVNLLAVRFLRLAEMVFGTSPARELASAAGWRTG